MLFVDLFLLKKVGVQRAGHGRYGACYYAGAVVVPRQGPTGWQVAAACLYIIAVPFVEAPRILVSIFAHDASSV